ncbi:MAG: hypothetical protein JSS49_06980 [Planctomycetes bacterium]|nr:hypothetical protein [Planctomycetota bacterium]
MSSAQFAAVRPSSDQLFEPVLDSYGLRLALVLGNHAADGQCPFFKAALCHHCDIGRGEGAAFDLLTNRRRLAWYREHFADVLQSTAHLVIYNSGSVLNPMEMPMPLLEEVLEMAREQTSIRVVSFDSRESFVTAARVMTLANRLRSDQCVRIILGIESASDVIRNQVLQKEMTDSGIQRVLDQLAVAADSVGWDRVGLDVNIVIGAPGTSRDTAVADARQTASHAISRSRVSVDFNLHPYYPSKRGLKRFPDHPRCSEQILAESLHAVLDVPSVRRPRIFIGLNDEGHDTAADQADSLQTADWIQTFNATQVLPQNPDRYLQFFQRSGTRERSEIGTSGFAHLLGNAGASAQLFEDVPQLRDQTNETKAN